MLVCALLEAISVHGGLRFALDFVLAGCVYVVEEAWPSN